MRISREQMFMEYAKVTARRGTCGRLAVGAVIAKRHRPVAAGYAGPPSGEPHCWEAKCNRHKPCDRTLHAEANAIDFAVAEQIDIRGCDMYITDSPCLECARRIWEAGIVRVYFNRPYRSEAGIELLTRHGIQVFHVLDNGIINECLHVA